MALTNPHDKFFRELLSRQEVARDFLRHYLPPEIAGLLDLTSLTISKDTFIDQELREHFSDILYQVRLNDGEEAAVYTLFEHKSSPEPFIGLQLLRYMVRIWEQLLKQREPLKPIVPVVVYHGQTAWNIAPNFAGLFDAPSAIAPFLPDYRYVLIDLSRYTDEEIKGQIFLQTGLLLLKYIFRDDLAQQLPKILILLRELTQKQTGLEYLETVLRYIVSGTDKISAETLKDVVEEVIVEGGSLMPTIAEQWIEEGRLRGIERGIERGIDAQRQTILQILQTRFTPTTEQTNSLSKQLEKIKSLTTLQALASRALHVFTLTDFQAHLNQTIDLEKDDET